jgi:hypothetical protein
VSRSFTPDALLQARHESSGINEVGWPVELPDAGRQIDGRGNRHHAGNQIASGIPQFAGQLQHHIAAQREAGQKDRRAARELP